MPAEPDCERDQRQRRICVSTSGEHRTPGNVQVVYAMDTAVAINHTFRCLSAHPRRAHVMPTSRHHWWPLFVAIPEADDLPHTHGSEFITEQLGRSASIFKFASTHLPMQVRQRETNTIGLAGQCDARGAIRWLFGHDR